MRMPNNARPSNPAACNSSSPEFTSVDAVSVSGSEVEEMNGNSMYSDGIESA